MGMRVAVRSALVGLTARSHGRIPSLSSFTASRLEWLGWQVQVFRDRVH